MVPDWAERGRVLASPALRPAAWILSLAMHAIAAALLLAAPIQVLPEQGCRAQMVELVFPAAPSGPEEANAGPAEAELPAAPRLLPAPEPAAQPPAEAVPSPSPVNEPAPPSPDPTPEADAPTPSASLPARQPPAEALVLPAPPKAESESLSAAVPPPAASPGNPPRRPATRRLPPKPVERQPSPPGSAIAVADGGAPARAAPAPASLPPGAPVLPAAPPPLAAGPTVIDPAWLGALDAWMQAHRRYPDAARRSGEDGTVGVAFTVSPDGAVLTVQVVRSSGSALLDQAVYDMLIGQKVPAFPAGMTGAQARVAVNVRFSLDR